MATTRRRKRNSLSQNILRDTVTREGAEFEFHALVRLLEVFAQRDDAGVGEGVDPSRESVRFRALVSMEFAQSDVSRAVLSGAKDEPSVPHLVETQFFGLAGLQGPLPAPYTQRILARIQERDYSMRDFLDIFNHRLLSLLHKVRKNYWVGVSAAFPEDTAVGRVLQAFIGENSWLKNHMVPVRSLLSMAVCFWQRPRSAELLRMLLSIFLRTHVALKLFEYGWRRIHQDQQTAVGQRYAALGVDAVLGKRFLDTSYSFTIVVGPVSLERYFSLLRGGVLFEAIQHICHSFIGQHNQYRLNVLWSAKERPQMRLGEQAVLGSTAWLHQFSGGVESDKQTIMTYIVEQEVV